MALRIQLFGGLGVAKNGKSFPAFPTYKSSALFAYLVLHHGRLHPRQVLASLFWGGRSERASRKCLRTELWRIRRLLATNGSQAPLMFANDSVGFYLQEDVQENVQVDVMEFERRILPGMRDDTSEVTPEERSRLLEAVELWRGELLEGWYEDWCIYPRERLNSLYAYALRRLMQDRLSQGKWSQAVVRGFQLLQADPLHEQAHGDLMYCYWRMGNRPAALRQYDLLVRTLREELEIEPMERIRVLFEQIRNDEESPRARLPAAPAEEE